MSSLKNLKKWQNYVHYLLNGLFLLIELYFLQDFINTSTNDPFSSFLGAMLILFTFVALIFINDSIIHLTFYYLPKPLRWRD